MATLSHEFRIVNNISFIARIFWILLKYQNIDAIKYVFHDGFPQFPPTIICFRPNNFHKFSIQQKWRLLCFVTPNERNRIFQALYHFLFDTQQTNHFTYNQKIVLHFIIQRNVKQKLHHESKQFKSIGTISTK